MSKLKIVLNKEIFLYIIAVFICCYFLYWVLQLWNADLKIPFDYHKDTLMTGASIKGMIDTGWYTINNYIGAPYGFQYYDFASNMNLDMGIMKLIALVFPNWAETLNIYYLLTFPLVTITSLFVFRRLKVSKVTSLVGSLLFTFLPFHFLQGEPHIILAAYYMIPLIIMVCLWLFEEDFTLKVITNDQDTITREIPRSNDDARSLSSSLSLTMEEGKGEGDTSAIVPPHLRSLQHRGERNSTRRTINWRGIGAIAICLGVGSTFIYYPFFACFILLIAGAGAAISRTKWQPLLNSGMLIGIMVLLILIYNLPTIFYQLHNGSNMLLTRDPADTERYGLKIVELLFPIQGNHVPFLAAIADKYQNTAPNVNENSSAALGIMGSIGFIILLVTLFYHVFRPKSGDRGDNFTRLTHISVLNGAAVLLGTVGGLGTITAYLVFPQIRTYTRISIFIAFFSLLAIAWIIEYLINKMTFSRTVINFIMIAVLLIGINDQTSSEFIPEYQKIKQEYVNDDNFVKHIESAYPDDKLVFQLPYNAFPECRPPGNMQDYDLFKGYLHSTTTSWSFGTIKGREGDAWQRKIAIKPIDEMLRYLSSNGFKGVYVDSFGYEDNGEEILSSLNSKLYVEPLVSDNGRLYFFDMTLYNNRTN